MFRWHNEMEESSMMNLDEFQSQNIVTNTTTKAAYMIALVATKEGICVKKFVYQTRCSSKQASNMKIYWYQHVFSSRN